MAKVNTNRHLSPSCHDLIRLSVISTGVGVYIYSLINNLLSIFIHRLVQLFSTVVQLVFFFTIRSDRGNLSEY